MNLPSATTATASSASPERCGECGNRNPWVMHTVRLRGALRVLCTHCVLRNHPTSFCPSCFAFYDSSPPHPSRRVSCSKCFSLTHSHCAPDAKPHSYLCPPCRSPSSFSFFQLSSGSDGVRFIDKRLADIILCAARIASASMTKAVSAARCDADRRAREAALARKRAREALEHVVMLAGKEKARAVVPRVREASVEHAGFGNRQPSPDLKAKATNMGNGGAKETERTGAENGEVVGRGNMKQEADASK